MTAVAGSIDPRVANTRRAVLEATEVLLVEAGFDRITVDGIAERSGVARSTIYRNWPNRADLLAEVFERLCAFAAIPDTGSLGGDLRALGREIAHGLEHEPWGRVLPSLVGAAHHDPELAEAQERFSQRRRALVGAIYERAAARGEIDAGVDAGALAELFVAPFFFRRLFRRDLIDDDFVEQQVTWILRMAAVGSEPQVG